MTRIVAFEEQARHAEHLYLTGAAATDAGVVRSSNQDSILLTIPGDQLRLEEKGVLAIVADGMGGHAGGEIASSTAVRVVTDTYYAANGDPQSCLSNAFEVSNRCILEKSQSDQRLAGMGTTCTAVAVVNGFAYCAHIGDSRVYLLRESQMYCMTEDHSAPMDMFRRGLLTLAEARAHEDRNIILRAMGTRPEIEAATWDPPLLLRADDRLLLCSDGLYDAVHECEFVRFGTENDLSFACRELLRLAAERVASDNASVILLRVHGSEVQESRKSKWEAQS